MSGQDIEEWWAAVQLRVAAAKEVAEREPSNAERRLRWTGPLPSWPPRWRREHGANRGADLSACWEELGVGTSPAPP